MNARAVHVKTEVNALMVAINIHASVKHFSLAQTASMVGNLVIIHFSNYKSNFQMLNMLNTGGMQ